ncbi:uncharacterized protein LOC131242504 isoform X2 [Magnolia sinica]|uniref:uncharacterized protein LOC131242504 isoform X2 n=1 Tax=Magnolia sinica TaxID=86752 RepID=UPI00265AF24B|nr:uncharacterized protein LOC131242504 isoform X2 [Magnolia sinica]
MAAIHWYGPLINLSEAASHIGDYVQLLVFVHRSRPIQKFKASNGGGLLKTDIQVGDDTRSYFPMSLWQKHMASMIFAGDIVLLQNVKIVKFGDVLEAATVQFSSLLPLVHPFELLASKGVDELLGQCRVGRTTKEKLKKVVRWVQQTGSMLHNVQENFLGKDIAQQKNWKVHEERKSQDCISISELLCITESCNATFYACIGEIFLPFMWKPNEEFEKEKMFVSKRVSMMADNNVVEDLVCTGCKLCGSPIDFGYTYGTTRNISHFLSTTRLRKSFLQTLLRRVFMHAIDDKRTRSLSVKVIQAALLIPKLLANQRLPFSHRASTQNVPG